MPTQFALAPLNPDAEKESLTDRRAVAVYETFRTAALLSLRAHYTQKSEAAQHPRVAEYWDGLRSDLDVALELRHWARS